MLYKRWRCLLQIKNNIKKFKKDIKNLNWKTRYNNLHKKYEQALDEIEMLKTAKDVKQENYIRMIVKQRNNLREEVKELIKEKND